MRGRLSHLCQPCDLIRDALLALNMITIEETLVVDAEGHAVLTLPPSVKPGLHRAVVQIEETATDVPPGDHSALIGLWRGKMEFAPDFDAPLEDFRDYME